MAEEPKKGSSIQKKSKHVLHTSKTRVGTVSELTKDLDNHPKNYRFSFQSQQLNDFWGGGLPVGSVTLLAGEPGLGKSTFALQLLRSIYGSAKTVLYVSAEESSTELARRCKRLNIPPQVIIAQAARYSEVEKILNEIKPDVVIVDSIQTLFSDDLTGSPGSVSQVTGIATGLLNLSKTLEMSMIIVGHVTKDGSIAGPRTLEHLVDSVALLERADGNYRTLSFQKHRFGTTEEMLLLQMVGLGLEIIADPSLALLENIESGVGVVYGMAIEKGTPLVVEVQALVSAGGENQSYGRREAIGVPVSRIHTVLAIAEKYLGLKLRSCDVYVKLTGVNKKPVDASLDLVILLAIISSAKEKSIEVLLKNKGKKHVYAGRLTLSGLIRKPTFSAERQKAADRLKFTMNGNVALGDVGKIMAR